MRALGRHAIGDFDAALADLDVALGVDGDDADIYNDRGRVKAARGDLAGARTDYNAAARLRPGWSRPLSNRGWASLLAGDCDEAERDFTRALALDAEDALARFGRDSLAMRRSDAAAGSSLDATLINDPEIARLIAAAGNAPVLAALSDREP